MPGIRLATTSNPGSMIFQHAARTATTGSNHRSYSYANRRSAVSPFSSNCATHSAAAMHSL